MEYNPIENERNEILQEVLQLIKELKDENKVVRECGCDRNEYCNKCSNLDHFKKQSLGFNHE